MYDILFIDDKFEEIKESFSSFQSKHSRCFYSDGENHLPATNKEKLPFKNLKYISLDLHLENRGITTVKDNKTALSTLASVIQSFVNDGKDMTIIVNTSYPDDFNENDFFKYLDFETNPVIEKNKKNDNNSLLHQNSDSIIQQAHQEVLRNIVIREAIEIENLIYKKVQENFTRVIPKLSSTQLDKIKRFDFRAKIQLYKLLSSNDVLDIELTELRELRNKFAHGTNPPEKNLLEFLEFTESLKQKITGLN